MSPSSKLRRPVYWFIGIPIVLVVLVVGGTFVYVQFIREDPLAEATFSDLAPASADASPAAAGAPLTTVDGTWTVTTGQAGYRVHEVRFGSSLDAVGRTDEVTGDLTIEGTTVSTANLKVQLASVETDEGARDGQFRGRIMDVATYPTATFELTQPLALASLPNDQEEVTVPATGEFTIHGVTKEVTFDLTARRNGSRLEVDGSIAVKWADYDIPDPSFGPNQVDDNGVIEFVVAFVRA